MQLFWSCIQLGGSPNLGLPLSFLPSTLLFPVSTKLARGWQMVLGHFRTTRFVERPALPFTRVVPLDLPFLRQVQITVPRNVAHLGREAQQWSGRALEAPWIQAGGVQNGQVGLGAELPSRPGGDALLCLMDGCILFPGQKYLFASPKLCSPLKMPWKSGSRAWVSE